MRRMILLAAVLAVAAALALVPLSRAAQEPNAVEELTPDKKRYVDVIQKAIQALETNDQPAFESLFLPTTVGMQPGELYRAAHGVLGRFGKVRTLGFGRFDGKGAFLKVRFEKADRELFVQLNDAGKLRELTYVPPATAH